MDHTHRFDTLFHPKRIAVVGVSRDPNSVGQTLFANILDGGYEGTVYPINPHADTIRGKKAYASLTDVPEPIDCAIIAIPAPAIIDVLEICGTLHIPTVIIISSGFGEIGEEGKAREDHIRALQARYHMTILGPNCLGMIHPSIHLNASFAKTMTEPGSIACISQSGALGSALLDIFQEAHIGLSHFFSMGNKVDIKEYDLLEALADDIQTTVIGLYVESLEHAENYIAVLQKLKQATPPKPVVILKAGKTKEGTMASKSHTGAIAGRYDAYKALCAQSGMILTETIEEFLTTLTAFAYNPLPHGTQAAIITNAGGPAILATDVGASCRIQFPPIGTHHNPYDLLGDAHPDAYHNALEASTNAHIHGVHIIMTAQRMTDTTAIARMIAQKKPSLPYPLLVTGLGSHSMKEAVRILQEAHVPVTQYPEPAMRALGHMMAFSTWLTHDTHRYTPRSSGYKEPKEAHTPFSVTNALLSQSEALSILTTYGIPTPQHVMVREKRDLVHCNTLSKRVALKIVSPDIVHKTDVGGVLLNVPKEVLASTYDHLITHITSLLPNAHIEGVLVMDMVTDPSSYEFVIGMKKEPGLGSLILLGMGGILLELHPDTALRFVPLTYTDAEAMIETLHAYPLFTGYRGKKPLNKTLCIEMILRVNKLIMDHPEIQEIDINPILIGQDRAIALDARIIV